MWQRRWVTLHLCMCKCCRGWLRGQRCISCIFCRQGSHHSLTLSSSLQAHGLIGGPIRLSCMLQGAAHMPLTVHLKTETILHYLLVSLILRRRCGHRLQPCLEESVQEGTPAAAASDELAEAGPLSKLSCLAPVELCGPAKLRCSAPVTSDSCLACAGRALSAGLTWAAASCD